MQDATDYKRLRANCMTASKTTMLTSVGYFVADSTTRLEVVADTHLPDDDDTTRYENPSITVFDASCTPVWSKAYPAFAEVGFKSIAVAGQPMLYVSAITVLVPGDQTIADGTLLSFRHGEIRTELSFGDDKYDLSTFGALDKGSLGVVTIHNSAPMRVRFDSLSKAVTGPSFVGSHQQARPSHLHRKPATSPRLSKSMPGGFER